MANEQSSSSSLWLNCRPEIQRRVNALLNYQAEYFRLRVEFHQQLQELQYTYNPQFERILERRRKIIDGSAESTEVANMTNQMPDFDHGSKNGIDQFWLTVLKNLDSYDYPIHSRDELCLKHLTDIRCILRPRNTEPAGFTLEFHFSSSNPFFSEPTLTKDYSIQLELDPSNPYRSYDGPEVTQCQSCSISWKPDQNLTIRKRNKRVRNKATGQIRLVEIEESIKSFFDFFSPPVIPADGIEQMSDEDQIQLEADIEFGLLLKQHVLPRAILYYTGEALTIFDEETDESTSSNSSEVQACLSA